MQRLQSLYAQVHGSFRCFAGSNSVSMYLLCTLVGVGW
jgi:hypothetical protein